MNKTDKIFVAGHRGMVGSAIVRRLLACGYQNIITKSRQELDLTHADSVKKFYQAEQPQIVVVAAAKVGGILANYEQPVEFLLQNLQIQNNLISGAADFNAEKLLFLGSSCIYPKFAPQPIPESALLTGELEMTNEPYAIAKIAGIKLCQAYVRQYGKNFISGMPTNLYGPFDNFNLQTSHVLPALIRKVHEAKKSHTATVSIWGTGSPRREFLYVDDLADACVFLLNTYHSAEIVNIGSGEDITIRELAETICEVIDYQGKLEFDTTKPDGTPRKLMDNSRLRELGWTPRVGLKEGIQKAYQWFLENPCDEVM